MPDNWARCLHCFGGYSVILLLVCRLLPFVYFPFQMPYGFPDILLWIGVLLLTSPEISHRCSDVVGVLLNDLDTLNAAGVAGVVLWVVDVVSQRPSSLGGLGWSPIDASPVQWVTALDGALSRYCCSGLQAGLPVAAAYRVTV